MSEEADNSELGPLRDERGRYLRLPPGIKEYAWKKGVSPNPQGHSGLYGKVVKLAREASPAAIRRLIELIDSEDERVAFTSANAVIERAFGRPQPFDPTKERSRAPFDPSLFSPEQLAMIQAVMQMIMSVREEKAAETQEILPP